MSQLHQLRGRIGRGGFASFCFLHSTSPPQTPAGQRLEAVAATTDGGELAEIDLRLRGEGDVLGSRQSGLGSRLALLRLTTDLDIVVAARARAARLIASDPGLRDHAALAAEVDRLLEDAAYLEKG
jgi:ATP-dependent DNA helicase RecG